MKVKELIALFTSFNPEAEVVVHRDCANYGFGLIDKISVGVYEATDYGNDFLPYQQLIVKASEIAAVCIYPQDSDAAEISRAKSN